VDLLIKTIAELRGDGYDVGLVVAGTGEEHDRLEQLVDRQDIKSEVVFAGYVPESELASYYKSADVFACPGWMSYGITPLEAYAMRTPVAVSSDAFVHEVLGQSSGVEVIPPLVDEWALNLPRLLSEDFKELNSSVVPTWDEFCEKLCVLARDANVLD
jgi:glycosyltransferase involved in cell wall biosynthesis